MMRKSRLAIAATALIGLGSLAAGDAAAQGVAECYTGAENEDEDGWEAIATLADPATQCLSAVVTTYRNDATLIGLSPGGKIKAAFDKCNLPNGPYRRAASFNDAGADTRLDYIVISTNKNNGADSADAAPQIGGNPGDGSFAPETATVRIQKEDGLINGAFTIRDTTVINSGAATDQIVDVPGFEWVMFLKNSGNAASQTGTLVCEINAWYDVGGGTVFGLYNFVPDHSVTDIDVGYATGPSGFGSQANVNTACGFQNPVLSVDNDNQVPPPADNQTAQERYTAKLLGAYKVLPGDPSPPINATSCATPAAGIALEKFCDGSEFIGRPNACNSGGAASGVSGYVQQQAGTGTTCEGFYFGGFSGSPTLGTTSLCGSD